VATRNTDLEQTADVHWLPVDTRPAQGASGGDKRRFESLRDAILFVMETLTPSDRAVAWIALDRGLLEIEEIERLYSEIKSHKDN
jgi:hypothetical protein